MDYLFPVIATIFGCILLIRNILFIRDESRMMSHLETSPQGKFCVEKFGLEKAAHLSQSVLLPLGCVISFALIVFGSFGLLDL